MRCDHPEMWHRLLLFPNENVSKTIFRALPDLPPPYETALQPVFVRVAARVVVPGPVVVVLAGDLDFELFVIDLDRAFADALPRLEGFVVVLRDDFLNSKPVN
mmetsp:Transcript_25916/g.55480  ORF Transcript_25916/g.55480 Transcript_25916/m.55480 type:complete len:103 (+) Transcript_25916:619-927(+)